MIAHITIRISGQAVSWLVAPPYLFCAVVFPLSPSHFHFLSVYNVSDIYEDTTQDINEPLNFLIFSSNVRPLSFRFDILETRTSMHCTGKVMLSSVCFVLFFYMVQGKTLFFIYSIIVVITQSFYKSLICNTVYTSYRGVE